MSGEFGIVTYIDRSGPEAVLTLSCTCRRGSPAGGPWFVRYRMRPGAYAYDPKGQLEAIDRLMMAAAANSRNAVCEHFPRTFEGAIYGD